MITNETLNPMDLIQLVKGHKVYIQGHNYPDPDAIGSAFGLQQFLKYHGIESTMCYVGQIDRFNTRFMIENFGIDLQHYDEIKEQMLESDYVINVDCQKPNSNTTDIIGNEIACIDHHPIFIETDEYHYRDIRITGACASLVASYYYTTNTPIEKHVAAALAYAIKMDTDDLIRGVTDLDIDMFSRLYKDSDWQMLSRMYNYSIEFADLQAYGAAIENIEVYENIGFTYIPFECSQALVAILCDFMLSLDLVDIAVIYAMNADGLKFSVRSIDSEIHAGKLIQKVLQDIGGGGGHANMAGGFVPQKSITLLGNEFDAVLKERFITEIKENRK